MLTLLVLGGLLWFFVSLMVEEGFDWILFGITLLLGVLFSGPWTWRPALAHWIARREGTLETQTIAIGPANIEVYSSSADARIKWDSIKAIHQNRDRLFLFSAKTVAWIIPRRAFDSDADFEVFSAAARDYWQNRHRP